MEEDIGKKIRRIETRLDVIEKMLDKSGILNKNVSDHDLSTSIQDLLELPDTLRKTLLSLQTLGTATSEEVAGKTGRTRSIETVYLNQLSRLQYVTRNRKGRKIYYSVSRYY
jgi:predicted transcriptional regulator